MLRRLRLIAMLIASIAPAWAQTPATAAWQDPAKHQVRFVTVAEGVRLEVLDWGGSGRAAVLLAGYGNTAHVFDDFAPKLTGICHVYGITRRGFGASSHPGSGYEDQRLADDVLQVLEALKVKAPVLIGHSMGGGEMTTLASQHQDRVSGLIYLDAGADPKDFPASDPAYMELAKQLPAALRQPTWYSGTQSKSFQLFRDRQMQNEGYAFPEADLRNGFETNPDGTRGRSTAWPGAFTAVGDGQVKRDYTNIRVPVLSFFAVPGQPAEPHPNDPPQYQPKDEQERAAIAAFDAATMVFIVRYEKALLAAVPNARIVDLPGARHYVFLDREAEVLREMRPFIEGLR
jgi:non-heme chloroperoxidase